MPKSKYVELIFVDGPEVPKHSMAGYVTVSDYRQDGKRHIFMRLPDSEVGPPKQRRKKGVKRDQPAVSDLHATA